jgi:hypothetical protein
MAVDRSMGAGRLIMAVDRSMGAGRLIMVVDRDSSGKVRRASLGKFFYAILERLAL